MCLIRFAWLALSVSAFCILGCGRKVSQEQTSASRSTIPPATAEGAPHIDQNAVNAVTTTGQADDQQTVQRPEFPELLGIWERSYNMKSGSVNSLRYKYNLMTFYPDGRCTRYSEWDPKYMEGRYKVMRAEGHWRCVGDTVVVAYKGASVKDTTRLIDQFPEEPMIVPGAVEVEAKELNFTFNVVGDLLLRNDGNAFRRISSDPKADPVKIIEQENKKWKAISDEIYSPAYGYGK